MEVLYLTRRLIRLTTSLKLCRLVAVFPAIAAATSTITTAAAATAFSASAAAAIAASTADDAAVEANMIPASNKTCQQPK